jgi:RNA polymerase sigma factor (sigma-70 family)
MDQFANFWEYEVGNGSGLKEMNAMATAQLDTVLQHLRRATCPHDGASRTDGELLECFVGRHDETAFAALVRRHGPMVLGVCRRILRNEADAADAFQATFLVLVRKAATIFPRERVGNWLYGVACNTAQRARAATARRRMKEREAGVMPRPEGRSDSWQRLCDTLDRELAGLPYKFRVPILLCDLEGKTRKQVARQLRWAEGTVASRLARARALLARRLARHGLALSAGALAAQLSQATASASVPAVLVVSTIKAASHVAARPAAMASGISTNVAALTEGVLKAMFLSKLKTAAAVLLLLSLFLTGALLLARPTFDGNPNQQQKEQSAAEAPQPAVKDQPAPKGNGKAKWRSCIILWMSGGPSQLDTFDPKPGHPNGGPIKAIDTAVKGIQISEHLPALANLTKHLAIIRSMTHKEGDHVRAAHLMRTGYPVDESPDHPVLGAVLAKELGGDRPDLPAYITISPMKFLSPKMYGPGFLGPQYGPLLVGDGGFAPKAPAEMLKLPPVAAFEALAKGKGEKLRKSVEKAFDLKEEPQAVHAAYGDNLFGQGCLLARRLVEKGVPVVEVTMNGWDTHGDNFTAVKGLSDQLDPALATLLTDLKNRNLLDSTLIVWMGEFGRTPKINAQLGRDHWPLAFSVVLAGGGIKTGQVIGKTSVDGFKVEEGPVKPSDLHATIYQALGIDSTKEYVSNKGQKISLVEKGAKALKVLLP